MKSLFLVLAFLYALCAPAGAQTDSEISPQAGPELFVLSQQLANPVSTLIRAPLQENWDTPIGPDSGTRFQLNLQPVMPFSVGSNWNVIPRISVPILSQPAMVEGGDGKTGIGNVLFSTLISPSKSGGFQWGIGPALQFRSSNYPELGSQQWAAGVTGVIARQAGPWTYGMAASQVWSFAANNYGSLDRSFLEPFVTYVTQNGLTIGLNAEAISGEIWTIPVNVTVSKLVKIGGAPISFGVGYGHFVDKPPGGPSSKIRTVVTFLFPR